MPLSDLLAQRSLLMLDGAMGTELGRLGVDLSAPLWSARALISMPHVVRNLHFHYLHAGADIITTNTFRSNIRALRKAGMAEEWEDINLRAVQFAFEARDRFRPARPVLIAGGLAPVEDCYRPEDVPPDDELREEHRRQAALLAMSGVDLLLAETMMTIREAVIAAEACAATGKQFAVSFVTDGQGTLLSGESLQDAVAAVSAHAPAALLLNCVAAAQMKQAYTVLRQCTSLPTGCYANTGQPGPEDADGLRHDADVGGYVAASRDWVTAGARIIGGCCGTTPAHIEAMAREHLPGTLAFQKKEIDAYDEERYGQRPGRDGTLH